MNYRFFVDDGWSGANFDLVEYLNRTMIKHFFKEGYVEYTTFKDNAKYLLENGLVDQKQLTGVFYE